MTQLYPEPRVFTPIIFYRHTVKAFRAFPLMLRSQRMGLISKAFQERIMLAVTEVNGCKYCNYYHTSLAIKEGISKAEIRAMRLGNTTDIPEDEAPALMYAQHYADTGGISDPETRDRLINHYGIEKARGIEASIKTIMVGNIYGIAIDGLLRRFRGKKMKGSKLSYELGIIFGSLLLFPVALVHTLFYGGDSYPR
jgi:AhpD family alkylhydroperoxidase